MKTEELEILLEGQSETQRVEFKSACSWDVNIFAKDILALSNVRDGGYIIVGVDDGSFSRTGVETAILRTYKIDTMRDQMASLADPHVLFERDLPEDNNGLRYVVIKVSPFRDIPVICRRNNQSAGINEGKLYYRNSNRRPESAAISNSYDMRDIIEMATVRMMQKKKEQGFEVKDGRKTILDKELEGL